MNGYWTTETRIKADATPIDNVEKFAWYDGENNPEGINDYETVEVFHEYTADEIVRMEQAKAAKARQEKLEQAADMVALLDIVDA